MTADKDLPIRSTIYLKKGLLVNIPGRTRRVRIDKLYARVLNPESDPGENGFEVEIVFFHGGVDFRHPDFPDTYWEFDLSKHALAVGGTLGPG